MAFWDTVKRLLAAQPILMDQGLIETRAIDSFVDHPGLTEQLLAVQGLTDRPWRAAGLREALGVPAIFGAVTLISNVVGSLTMRALRNEIEIPPDDRPRVIVRPDPFTIPREFYRQTAYNMATRGEAWWWIAARDIDGNAISVLNVNPAEVTVTRDERDLRYPIIEWAGRRMPNADMRQLVYQRDSGGLRGYGPLQICGAAISVAVEAQEWAANFYAGGGNPPTVIKSAVRLTETEATALKTQWMAGDNNTPKVVDDAIESVNALAQDTEGAQMMTARDYQNGDVARMFGMPASLLDYASSGSSLTYQNVGMRFDDFLRRCLRPNYLVPIEQTMSDLLPRATVARFDADILVMSDIKTRYDTYGVGIDKGIITSEEARSFEGLAPGDTDNAPVPFSPPQAVPNALPIQARSEASELRCSGCRRKLAEAAGPGTTIVCQRCKTVNTTDAAPLETRNVADERWHEFMAAMAQRPEPQQPIVNVYPADVTVNPPEVNVHPADVTVNPPSVHVEQPHITVEQPDLAAAFDRVMAGQEQLATRAIEALEKASERPVNVTVETPDVHVDSPVHIHEGAVNAPVTVQQPQPLPVAAPQPMRRVVKRDKADRIIEVIEEPA
jgi:HK97 family phage portal protein